MPGSLHPLTSETNNAAAPAQHNQPPRQLPICAQIPLNVITQFTILRKRPASGGQPLYDCIRRFAEILNFWLGYLRRAKPKNAIPKRASAREAGSGTWFAVSP